jgi:hypothetical protein
LSEGRFSAGLRCEAGFGASPDRMLAGAGSDGASGVARRAFAP